ncbi:MAG: NAD-dependent epimerase/dehydratase family protein [bacterium]
MVKKRIKQEDIEYIVANFEKITQFENKKIMITGCAGFLGYYITHFFVNLIEDGLKIDSLILLDTFLLGKPEWIEKIEGSYSNVKIYSFDISKDDISQLKDSKDVDYILHMASIASPTFYRKYPVETIDANIWGLRRLIDYYKDSEIKGFLFFSSSEVYGDPTEGNIPTSEEYRGNVSCMGPRACYDEAKRFGETISYIFANKYKMPISIVRPFNNYGPGMSINDMRVPADFAKCVLNNKDIYIHSDGNPTRTFCYVADAIVGYLKVLTYGKFDYFNIGIAKPEINVQRLAEIYSDAAKDLFGYNIKIIFRKSKDVEYLTHNPFRRCPDISKAVSKLGYNPKIEVEEGVKRFITFLKEEE